MLRRTLLAAMIVAATTGAAVVQPAYAASTAKIGIGLNKNTTTKSYLAQQIRMQAKKQGVRVSEREVQTAAARTLRKLKANGRGPLKGIIHVKIKKLTICVSWGADKDHCKGGA